MRSRFLLAIPLAATALLSACSAGTPVSAAAALFSATDRATGVDSVAFEMTMTGEGPGAAGDFSLSARGAIDSEARRAWVHMEAKDSEEIAFEWRIIDDTSFIKAGGELWIEMPATLFEEDMFDGLAPLRDPLAPFEELRDFDSEVTRGGTEEVRGRKAERYSVTLDPARVAAEQFGGPGEGITAMSVDVWVDEDGWPVRLATSMELDAEDDSPSVITFVTEYFDYGKPVEVERPADDEVLSAGDFENVQPGGRDPFKDAACHGERLAECLNTNPEVDALAADPALCKGKEARLCIVPVGWVRRDAIDAIVNFHRETKGIEVVVLPGIPLEPSKVDSAASQITAETLWGLLQQQYGVTSRTASTYIAMTGIDARSADFGWLFGSRWGSSPFGHNHGVFSYFRMAVVPPYSGQPLDDRLFLERVVKYTARYTAILFLDFPLTEDINYLNYYEMYGFSDLDAMQPRWPEGTGICHGEGVCIIPDGEFTDPLFEEDLKAVTEQVAKDLRVRIDIPVRTQGSYYTPIKASWSDEFGDDLRNSTPGLEYRPGMSIIGVSDDQFARGTKVEDHADKAWPEEHLGVISGFDAGTPGTAEHRERLYRLLYRAIARAHFGIPLDDDPESLMFEEIRSPRELDGKRLPVLP